MPDMMVKTACPHMDEPFVLTFQIRTVLGGNRDVLHREGLILYRI
jgi:hypothetical protein